LLTSMLFFHYFTSIFQKVAYMNNIDLDSLIPHRGKMKIISGIIEITEKSAVSTAVVKSDWPLYGEGGVNSLVLIEAIAQTAALIEGYKKIRQKKSFAKGWLVGIKNAEFYMEKISVNTNLIIVVESKYTFENYAVVEGNVRTGEKTLATATLQAMRLNEDNQ
jgi:predicted hotdog family 3-hydroxylacyl-ACP dehydratase